MSKILFLSKYHGLCSYIDNYRIIENLNIIDDDAQILIVDIEKINENQLDDIINKTNLKIIGISTTIEYNSLFFKLDHLLLMPCNIQNFIYIIHQTLFKLNTKNNINYIMKYALHNIYQNINVNINSLLIYLNYYDENFNFDETYLQYTKCIDRTAKIDMQCNLKFLCNWQKRNILMLIIILSQSQRENINLQITTEKNIIKFTLRHKNIVYNEPLKELVKNNFITKYENNHYDCIVFKHTLY